jgi:hypothetical protein
MHTIAIVIDRYCGITISPKISCAIRRVQGGLRRVQGGRRRVQGGLRRPKKGPRRPEKGPRRPKKGPRRPKKGPRRPKKGPRRPLFLFPIFPEEGVEGLLCPLVPILSYPIHCYRCSLRALIEGIVAVGISCFFAIFMWVIFCQV